MGMPKLPRKLEVILMGVFFAFLPGLCAGLLCLSFGVPELLSLIVGGGVFCFGLDIAFGKGCR